MGVLLRVSGWIDEVNERIGQVMWWCALVMILVGVYNATVRYLGNFLGRNLSSNAYLELQWYLFGAIFMLGAAYTLRRDGHVRVDVLYARLSSRGKAWVDVLGAVLFLLPFCAITLWLSLNWVEFSWKVHEMSGDPGGLARYPIKTVVPVAFGLLIGQGISQLIKSVAVLRGERQAEAGRDELEGL